MNFDVSPITVAVGSSHFGGHIPLSIGNVKYLHFLFFFYFFY